MASNGPFSQAPDSSADEAFRQEIHKMASDINSLGGRHIDGIRTPARNGAIRIKIRALISARPEGFFDNDANRKAFWNEIEGVLDSIPEYKDGLREAWRVKVMGITNIYRDKLNSQFPKSSSVESKQNENGNEQKLNAEAQTWSDFKMHLENSHHANADLDTPEFNEIVANLSAFATSLIAVNTSANGNGESQTQTDNLLYDLVSIFENLRSNPDIPKRAAYCYAKEALAQMTESCPLPPVLQEYCETEILEFERALSQLPAEEKAEEKAEVVREGVPLPYGYISRRLGDSEDRERAQRALQQITAVMENREDSARLVRLFRSNVYGFTRAMAEISETLVSNSEKGALGQSFSQFLSKNRKWIFVTTIAKWITEKIGWATINAGENTDTDDAFFDAIQRDFDSHGKTCFDYAMFVSFSAILGKKASDMNTLMQRDRQTVQVMKQIMSKIDAVYCAEVAAMPDKEGDTITLDEIMGEVEWLVQALEQGGMTPHEESTVSTESVDELLPATERVVGLTAEVNEEVDEVAEAVEVDENEVAEEIQEDMPEETPVSEKRTDMTAVRPDLNETQMNYITVQLELFMRDNPTLDEEAMTLFIDENLDDFNELYPDIGLQKNHLEAIVSENAEKVRLKINDSEESERLKREEQVPASDHTSTLIDMDKLPNALKQEVFQNIEFMKEFTEKHLGENKKRGGQLLRVIGAFTAINTEENIRSLTIPQIENLTRIVTFIRDNDADRNYGERVSFDAKNFTSEAILDLMNQLLSSTGTAASKDAQYVEVQDKFQVLGTELAQLEHRRRDSMHRLEGIKSELVGLSAQQGEIRAAKAKLTALTKKQEVLKAEMPDFDSREFAIWTEECKAIGLQKKELQELIQSKSTDGEDEIEFEEEKRQNALAITREGEIIEKLDVNIRAIREKLAHIKKIL